MLLLLFIILVNSISSRISPALQYNVNKFQEFILDRDFEKITDEFTYRDWEKDFFSFFYNKLRYDEEKGDYVLDEEGSVF